MDISEKVTELLKSKKCASESHKKIAGDIGIAPSVLSKLCAGNSKSPSADTVLAIAKYFNVSTDWLLGNADYPTTNKATQELCKTIGLSDVAIQFLQNPKNKGISDTIDKLIEQHLIYEKIGMQFIKGDGWHAKWSFRSILREIMLYFDLCRTENDVIISLNKQGELSVVSDNGEINANAKINKEKIIFDINENNELLHIVRFKQVALEERLDKLRSAMRKAGRNIDSLDKSYQKEVERLSEFAKENK